MPTRRPTDRSTARIPYRRLAATVAGLAVVAGLAGCGQKRTLDLDAVLAVFFETLQAPLSLEQKDVEAAVASIATTATSDGRVGEIPPSEQSVDADEAMLRDFTRRLNNRRLRPERMSARLVSSGAIVGFADGDGDLVKDPEDTDLFRIEVDEEQQRVIATDLAAPEETRRDRSYSGHHRYHGGGFWFGYMLGSMRGRSSRYYASNPVSRPNYSSMKMKPTGYATRSASRSTSRWGSGSARSRGGSRSFSRGK